MQVEIVFYDEMTDEVPAEHRRILRSRFHDVLTYLSLGFKTTLSNDLETLIRDSSAEYVLVMSLGSHFGGRATIQEMVDYAKAEKTPLVAHILHQDGCFQLHPQWFLVNTSVYRKIGCPRIRPDYVAKRSLMMVPNRSKENFHDDYTPLWLTPSKSYEMVNIPGHFFGVYLINGLLDSGYGIKNVPLSVRNKKSYCYPNGSWSELIQCLNDKSYQTENFNAQVFIDRVKDSYLDVYGDKGYYPINTEEIYPVNYNDRSMNRVRYNLFAGVCGGIKPALIAGADNFLDRSRVILFDASQAAIDWQKYLVKHWDGEIENFGSVFQNFRELNKNYRSVVDAQNSITDKFQQRLDEALIDKTELKRRWERFKSYDISFCKIDLLDEKSLKTLLDQLNDPDTVAYLWMSNSFHMDWQMFYLGERYMKSKLGETLEFIKQNTTSKMVVEHGTVLHRVR